MRMRLAMVWMLTLLSAEAQFADTPHPRLWLPASDEPALRERIEQDPLAASLQQLVLQKADTILDAPTCRYDIPDGRRLLFQSRIALEQTLHCAWAWRFTGERKYLDRAIAELTAACRLKDWNPPHFLDVAEMATAVAIGYDWLHADLSAEQRAMCEQAIRDKALTPAARLYAKNVWWADGRNNWAQVCGSGIAMAAIAIQGEDQGLAAPLISKGLALVKKCEHFYAPEGVYPEGPGYWHYGTNYHVMLLAACEALDHPASIPPLFEQSGNSMIHLHGPTRLPFNFADGKAYTSLASPAQAWIARHFKNPTQSHDLRRVLSKALESPGKPPRVSPLMVMWLPDQVGAHVPLSPHATFGGEQATATFRSHWDDDAAWLAIKGGTARGGHDHMDVGSFCYDAHGTRWIHDLGSDDYNMPGYFGSQRFRYFRLQNRSHNTLEIAGDLQAATADPCPITEHSTSANPAFARFDLSAAYAHSAKQVIRSASFDTRSGASTIRDEVTAPAGDIVWRAHTDARCSIDGDTVTLEKGKHTITLQRLSEAGIWSIETPSPPLDIEAQNEGYHAVTLTIPVSKNKNRIPIEIEIRP